MPCCIEGGTYQQTHNPPHPPPHPPPTPPPLLLRAQLVEQVDPSFLDADKEVHVGFEGHVGANAVSPRTLSSALVGQMVCVEGIITKCSLVRPKVVRSVHYCDTTGQFLKKDYRDSFDTSGAGPTGSSYPTKDSDGNPLTTEFGLCLFRANQVVTVQEMPERAPLGQLPRTVEVLLNDDLVDACKPGDRVEGRC